MSDKQHLGLTDMPAGSWVDRLPIQSVKPYLRLARMDRPIGTWLLLLPCWWSLALASPGVPDWRFALLFAAGSLVMRGAGCTINDIADRNYDGKVARTALRPIPSGDVSVKQAVVFLGVQLLIGLTVLIQFNEFAAILGLSSIGLVAIYPFAKRVTYWPQVVLGLTFNWGALMGWAVTHGGLGPAPVLLYLAGVFWTLGYDTIYAHQDKEDDAMIGVKSTALRLGAGTRPWLAAFYGAMVALLAGAGYHAALHPLYYAGLLIAAGHLLWQVKTVDIDDPKSCLVRFKSNRDVGFIVLTAIIAAQVFGVQGFSRMVTLS